jgi:hypothetical protein
MYDKLVPELKNDPDKVGYASMTDEQIAAVMLEPAGVEVVDHYASFRQIAAVLDDTEYNQLRNLLDGIAQQNRRVADMLEMLKLPGDAQGNGGGINFGHPAVRGFIEQLPIAQETKRKLLAIAERPLPRWKKIGLDVPPAPGNIASARAMIGG